MALTIANIKPKKYEPQKIDVPYVRKESMWIPRKSCGMIYCNMGMGKTTLLKNLSEAGLKVLIIDSDMGGTIGHNVCSYPCVTWKDFCNIIHSPKKGWFDIIAIDTIDTVSLKLREFTLDVLDISHPSIIPHGSGWDYENGLIIDQIMKLTKLDAHILFLGHSRIVEMKNARSETVKVRKPSLRGSLFRKIGALCAYIINIDLYGSKRIIKTQKTEEFDVKDRTKRFEDGIDLPQDGGKILEAYVQAFKDTDIRSKL